MSENHFLRRYNQIALAVLLTWALVSLAVISFYWWRSTQDFGNDVHWSKSNKPSVTGEEFETTDGTITAYKAEVPNDFEAVRDVRYVAMASGKVTTISNDRKALIYGERGVGKLGRVALIKTGERDDRPVFDFVFVSFPELNRFVVAQSIASLDTVQQLDDTEFSAIVWDDAEAARFVIVDAKNGKINATRRLEFSNSSRTSDDISSTNAGMEADAAPVEAAPQIRF